MPAVFLAALRLSALAACLAAGLLIAAVFGALSTPWRRRLTRLWCRGLLACVGVRLRADGAAPRGPALVVANHISWLDVIALSAVHPCTFVCKSEIAAWPAIGWLLSRTGTVFIRRGSFRDVLRVNDELRRRLAAGETVAAFPEGTTTDGSLVLPFRPALFQPCVERALPVHPAHVAYSSAAAAYVGDTSFAASFVTIARSRRLEARVHLLPALRERGGGRKRAAREARAAIVAVALEEEVRREHGAHDDLRRLVAHPVRHPPEPALFHRPRAAGE